MGTIPAEELRTAPDDRKLLDLIAELVACADSLRALEPQRIALAQQVDAELPQWPEQLTYQLRGSDGEMQVARMSKDWIDRHATGMALQWLSDDAPQWQAAKHGLIDDYHAKRDALWHEMGLAALEDKADAIGRRSSQLREEIIALPATTLAGLRAKARAVAMLFEDDDITFGEESCEQRLAHSIISDLLASPAERPGRA